MLQLQDVNSNPMVTKKKIARKYIQKEMRKEFKCFITKHQLNTKEDDNAGNEGQKAIRYTENK